MNQELTNEQAQHFYHDRRKFTDRENEMIRDSLRPKTDNDWQAFRERMNHRWEQTKKQILQRQTPKQ